MKKIAALLTLSLLSLSIEAGKKSTAQKSSPDSNQEKTVSPVKRRAFKNHRTAIESAIKLRKTIQIITQKPHHAYDVGLQNQLPRLWEDVACVVLAGFDDRKTGEFQGHPITSGMPKTDKLLMAQLIEKCIENEYELYCAAERLGYTAQEFESRWDKGIAELRDFNQKLLIDARKGHISYEQSKNIRSNGLTIQYAPHGAQAPQYE